MYPRTSQWPGLSMVAECDCNFGGLLRGLLGGGGDLLGRGGGSLGGLLGFVWGVSLKQTLHNFV